MTLASCGLNFPVHRLEVSSSAKPPQSSSQSAAASVSAQPASNQVDVCAAGLFVVLWQSRVWFFSNAVADEVLQTIISHFWLRTAVMVMRKCEPTIDCEGKE